MKMTSRMFLGFGVLASFSCSTIDEEVVTEASFTEGVPGGKVVETTTIKATVTGIDTTKRKITFVTPKGNKFSSTAGPEVVNFGQVRVGDQLTATIVEEVILRMAKPGEKLSDVGSLNAELAAIGARPGLKSTEKSQVVASVTAINTKRRKATLTFADGQSKKFKVRPDIDLSRYKEGDRVVISVTESVAVNLKKP